MRFKTTGKTCKILRVHLKKYIYISEEPDDAYAMFKQFFFLIFFIIAYVVGTHLNCIDFVPILLNIDEEYRKNN